MAHWVYRFEDGSYLAHRKRPNRYARTVFHKEALLGDARVFSSKGAATNAAGPVYYTGEKLLKGEAAKVRVILDRVDDNPE